MKLKDIIMQTSFDNVWPEARKVFHLFECSCQKEIGTLHRVFDVLMDIEPNPIESGEANCPLPKGSKMILRVVHGDVSGFVDKASLEKMTKEDREDWSCACGLGVLPLSQWHGTEVQSDLSPEAIVANFLFEVWRPWSNGEDMLKVLTQGRQTNSELRKQFKLENGVATFDKGTTYISEFDLGYDQCVKEIKTVILPDSVKYIDYNAFAKCDNLTSVIVNGNVTCIGGTLDETPWYNNQPDGLVYLGKMLYGYKGEMPIGTDVVIKEGTSGIANDAFLNCRGLTSIVIPNSTTEIGKFAFYGCSQLKSVKLPSSLNVMENGLFVKCVRLTSIVIPESVSIVESRVFESLYGLESIKLHRNVTEIVPYQFYDCSKLSSIIVDNENPVYDSRDDCNAIIETATNVLIAGCKTTIIPNTVKEIGDKAFIGCLGLQSVKIPSSVTSIGLGAFSCCPSLKTVVIKGTDTKIMPDAFDLDALQSIFVPAGSEKWYKSMLPEELHDKVKTSLLSN